MPRIGIVAGEASGDLLGEGLIRALKQKIPDIQVEGIGGPRMISVGCRTLFPMERLAVMGLIEVMGRYLELKKIQNYLIEYFTNNPPDIFIGIDAPDFNLPIEKKLKNIGISTIHYVSPSVWAWRKYRLRKISKSVDLIMTLFPFEADYYQKHGVPVCYVGHPLADIIPVEDNIKESRKSLGIKEEGELIAILPGSRISEAKKLSDIFLLTALWCQKKRPGIKFIAPMANDEIKKIFKDALKRTGQDLPINIIDGRSREVMAAANVILLASGTATLEALLLKRPMVTSYRLAPITYILVRWLSHIDTYTLPNLLAGEKIVPELLQANATPEKIGPEVLKYLSNPEIGYQLKEKFKKIHVNLRQNASEKAAVAVLSQLNKKRIKDADRKGRL